jgi:hypothetical protein
MHRVAGVRVTMADHGAALIAEELQDSHHRENEHGNRDREVWGRDLVWKRTVLRSVRGRG